MRLAHPIAGMFGLPVHNFEIAIAIWYVIKLGVEFASKTGVA